MPGLPSPEPIYRDVKAFLGGMIRGDVAVRQAGLRLVVGNPVVPSLLLCRNIRGKLRFELTRVKENKWVFGLFTRKTTEQIANIRLYLQIEPVVDPEPSAGLIRSTYQGPDFFEPTEDPKLMRLKAVDGKLYALQFKPRKRRVVVTDESEGFWTNGHKGYPDVVLADILETIKDWTLRKKEGRTVPLPPAIKLQLSGVMGVLGNAAAGLLQQVHTVSPQMTGAVQLLRETHADLEPHYRLDWLEIRILTWVNSAGRMLTKSQDPDAWLQVEAAAKLFTDEGSPELRHSLYLPDFLVVGNKYHSAFVEELRSDAALKQLGESAGGSGDAAAIEAFVRDAVVTETVVVARISGGQAATQDEQVDLDLVLMRDGRSAGSWLLFLIRFRVGVYPDVEPRFDGVESFVGGVFQGVSISGSEPPRRLADYLYRLLRVLTVWRIEPPEAVSP